MPNGEQRTEVWTYVGLREQKNGSFAYGWRDQEGNVYVFKKRFQHLSIGGQIEVTLTPEDKVVVTGQGAPKPLPSRYEGDEDIAHWVAIDEYANNVKRLKVVERQAAKVEPLEDILSTIRQLSTGLNGPQKRALAAVILQAVFVGAP